MRPRSQQPEGLPGAVQACGEARLERFEAPGAHVFFGYYDVTPFHRDGQRLLALRLPEGARPGVDAADLGLYRRDGPPGFQPFGQSQTWCWQQGCRLQWYPANKATDLVFHNGLHQGRYAGCIRDVARRGALEAVLPLPLYALSPDGRAGYSLDFSRLQRLRPGYGYANLPDHGAGEPLPDGPALWRVDLASGRAEPLLDLGRIAALAPRESMAGAEHYLNHRCVSPSGARLLLFHLWVRDKVQHSRLLTCDPDGGRLHVFGQASMVSHYCWKSDEEILCYSRTSPHGEAYALFRDRQGVAGVVGAEVFDGDGHCSLSPDGRWLLTDTYPDRQGWQRLLLYDGKRLLTALRQHCPIRGPLDERCDLHPRWSPDGRLVCVDSAAEGLRRMFVLDVSRLVADGAQSTLRITE